MLIANTDSPRFGDGTGHRPATVVEVISTTRVLRQHMPPSNVRACLRRASEEIEEICENVPVSESVEKRLAGIAEQLRYLVDGDSTDPEALARPDPDSLDTIRDHLTDVISEVDEDTATHLERARDEVLLASSVLADRIEKERKIGNESE